MEFVPILANYLKLKMNALNALKLHEFGTDIAVIKGAEIAL
jgi:hypothetical protein